MAPVESADSEHDEVAPELQSASGTDLRQRRRALLHSHKDGVRGAKTHAVTSGGPRCSHRWECTTKDASVEWGTAGTLHYGL